MPLKLSSYTDDSQRTTLTSFLVHLHDPRDEDVGEVGVDDLALGRGARAILGDELGRDRGQGRGARRRRGRGGGHRQGEM